MKVLIQETSGLKSPLALLTEGKHRIVLSALVPPGEGDHWRLRIHELLDLARVRVRQADVELPRAKPAPPLDGT